MAGIGFQLRRTLEPGTFSGIFKAYGYAALISSGPWVLSILSLAMLGLILGAKGVEGEFNLFYVSVTHVYAFSLMLTGPIQLILTRYAADRDYLKEPEKVFPAFLSALAMTVAGAGALGMTVFLFFVPGGLVFQLSGAFLFVVTSALWVTAVFLSSLKDYNGILFNFAIGYGTSFFLAWALGRVWGPEYVMLGFAVGQIVLLALFVVAVSRQYGNLEIKNFEFFSYFRTHYALAMVGFFYNLGVWADKLIFWWFSPIGEQVSGVLYSAPLYDAAVCLSFLTIIPGMTVFLLEMETEYAIRYQAFMDAVLKQQTLGVIQRRKKELVIGLREGMKKVIKVQSVVTGLFILFANDILQVLGLGQVQTGVFELSMLGVFLLVLFLSMLTVLFYLDKAKDAMWCCILFAVSNIAVTFLNISGGTQWYGTGFVFAGGISLLVTGSRVNRHHRLLEYQTFALQPL
jgi:uncharacterized membrane protein